MTAVPYFYRGLAENILGNLPSAVNIASSTNASPIVVTTSTDHGLKTGDTLVIVGAADPNANGIFRAGAVATTKKVELLNFNSGANVAGSLAGGAAGTVQPVTFGVEDQLPSDAVDGVTATSVNVPFEGSRDMLAYLLYSIRYNLDILEGGTVTLRDGANLSSLGTANVDGKWSFITASNLVLGGRKSLRRARVSIVDAATKTCGVAAGTGVDYAGDTFQLPSTTTLHAGVQPIIVLKSTGTGTTPQTGETLTFFGRSVSLSAVTYLAFAFHNEAASQIAHVKLPQNGGTFDEFWLRFEFVSGAWELAESSGILSDALPPDGTRDYGVFRS